MALSIARARNGLHSMAPLLLDIELLDVYLLNNTDIRIRLELANKDWILSTHLSGATLNLKVTIAKLWLDRIISPTVALESLNNSLISKPMTYTYNRSIYKMYVLLSNQPALLKVLNFSQTIPNSMAMVIVDMDAMNTSFDRSGLYFHHGYLNNVQITINGSTIYNVHGRFPHKHILFHAGSVVCAYLSSWMKSLMVQFHSEKSGNLRSNK